MNSFTEMQDERIDTALLYWHRSRNKAAQYELQGVAILAESGARRLGAVGKEGTMVIGLFSAAWKPAMS